MSRESAMDLLKHPSNVFYGWWIVVIGLVVDAFKHATFNRGFSFYVARISTPVPLGGLGIGLGTIAFAEMLGRLEGGVMGPIAGYLTDRLGPGVMLAFGGIVSGLGFILLSITHSYLPFMLVFVGLLSVGFRSGYNNASVPALNQWFRRRRSLAMSMVSTGNSIGGLLAYPVSFMVLALGWRTSALVSGIAIIAVVVPLSFLVKRSPESMGLLPDGERVPPESPDQQEGPQHRNPTNRGPSIQNPQARQSPQAPAPASVRRLATENDFTVREAMHTPSYWLLILSTGLRNTVHSGMSFLMASVMIWFLQGSGRGYDSSFLLSGVFVTIMSFSGLLFNPLMGWMGDRWPKPKLASIAMAGGAMSLVILLPRGGHAWELAIFVVLLAFSESANPLNWSIMGDFFGRRAFATLRGWQHLPDQLMSMSSAVWMGIIFDRTGSFYWALLPLAVIYGLSALFYWFLPQPRIPERLRARAVPEEAPGLHAPVPGDN